MNLQGKYQYFYAKAYRDVRAKMENLQERNKAANQKPAYARTNTIDLFKGQLVGDAAGRLGPPTYESYYYYMQGYVIPHFSLSKNTRLSERSTTAFVQSIHGNGAISRSYQKKVLFIFKTALREISKKSPEYTSFIEAVTLPKVKSCTEIPVFSMKGQRLVEYVVQSSTDQRTPGIILCFYTGIRLDELYTLQWGDIDFEAGTMSISRPIICIRNFKPDRNKTQLYVGTPKDRTSCRKIPLPASLLKLVEENYLGPTIEDCYMPPGSTEPFGPRTYQKLYKKLLKKAGIRTRKSHAIRHAFVTRVLELGVDIKTLSEILDYSNVSITSNAYTHSLMGQKKKAIKKLDEMHAAHIGAPSFAVSSAVVAAMPAMQTRDPIGGHTVLDGLRHYIIVSQLYYIFCKEENSGGKPVRLVVV